MRGIAEAKPILLLRCRGDHEEQLPSPLCGHREIICDFIENLLTVDRPAMHATRDEFTISVEFHDDLDSK